jgi:aspartyl-tRNA(Asn)/glutamyl-tRNA(Gln) amidotransferase subunit A
VNEGVLSVGPAGNVRSVTEIAAAIAAGDISCTELVQRSLADVERWQPSIDAFSQLWVEEALEEARRVDATPMSDRAPLAGIPLAVKDVYDVAGHETTGCCAAYRGRVATTDAETIARVRRTGVVLIGKTNQHEISAGTTTLVSACGPAGNPWNPAHMPGGSSGGSGAAVAAGIVPWALGSDTGGSVRVPAALCGTFALKPTTGSIPIEGMLPHSPTLDCPGPLASTTEDLWTLFLALAGLDPREPLGSVDPGSLRIGVLGGFHRDRVDDRVLAVVDAVAMLFEEAGCSVRPVEGAGIEDGRRIWARVAYPELAEAHPVLFDRSEQVDPSIMALLTYGRSLDPATRAAALDRRREIAAWYRERLAGFDALLVATTVTPAAAADSYEVRVEPGESVPEDFVGPGWLTSPVNLSGLPALNIPASRSDDGLPIGISLIGADGAERGLCRLARSWERESGYRPSWPAAP